MQENELDHIRDICSCDVGETDPKREDDQTYVYLHVLTNSHGDDIRADYGWRHSVSLQSLPNATNCTLL